MATLEQITFATAFIKGRYPQYAAYMQIPEIANAVTDALVEFPNATPEVLAMAVQGKIFETNWYKTTPEVTRAFALFSVSDPATAEAQITAQAQAMEQRLQSMGFPYDSAQVRDFARFQLITGASDQVMFQEMVKHFGKQITGSSGLQVPGVLGDTISQVQSQAYNYGIKISDDQARFFSTALLTGGDQALVTDFLRDQAKLMYPFIAPYLDQGYTVRQWADPYIQSAASELEINPATIDLTDPKWGRVLQPYQGAPLTLYDWQRTIRTDSSYGWDKTLGARTTASQFATQLGQLFGAIGG